MLFKCVFMSSTIVTMNIKGEGEEQEKAEKKGEGGGREEWMGEQRGREVMEVAVTS